jgi:hypothetical protein
MECEYYRMAKMYRQGDVLLRRIDELPEKKFKVNSDVLAEGEATGHHHRLVGQTQIYETAEKQRFVEVSSQAATLVHEEHKPIEIERGIYAVVNEREYNPFDQAIRQVTD